MYFWYFRIKKNRPKNMGGFTRILHSGKPDDWMFEIPTVIVDPLPMELKNLTDVGAFTIYSDSPVESKAGRGGGGDEGERSVLVWE